MKHKVLAEIEGLLKIWLTSKKAVVTAKAMNEEVLVLGNGPSLSQDFDALLKLAETRDVLGVNYFAGTNEFSQIKPNLYVVNSTDYWSTDQKKEWQSDRKKLFEDLVEKTEWKLDLFVPVVARKASEWIAFMGQNKNIEINYYNQVPVDENPKFFKRQLKNYKCCPRPHNVLVPSVLFVINMGYKKVYLAGADHSWIPEIRVNENSEVLIGQKHFYHDQFKDRSSLLKNEAKPMYNEKQNTTKTLHEVLLKFYYSFKSYWFLKEYAEIQQVEIINITKGSYIDAFKKIPIADVTV